MDARTTKQKRMEGVQIFNVLIPAQEKLSLKNHHYSKRMGQYTSHQDLQLRKFHGAFCHYN